MARRHTAALADHDHYASRRLVVVAAFDVVGFSTIVEANEDNALAAWRALRREIDPLITQGGGRIFKSLGDGLLVEFTSPVEATRAALEIQAAAAKMAPERDVRLKLRCAIHMGDVTVEGTDLLGDGINIVSRLQQHAPTGGVLVSAAVMDLIGGRIDAPIKDLGTLKLRNISRPVHAYMVGAGKRPRSTPAIDSFQRRRPSIAVLPFLDQSPRAKRDAGTATSYFSDGLVEDIISALSCLPELVVISRTSTLRYRGAAPDPRQIRRDLRRALPAVGQRAAGRRQGAAVGRAGGLRERHHAVERPLRRRRGRPLRAAGRALRRGWWRRSRRRCRRPSCAARCASGRRISTPMNASCAGSTCSTASRTTATSRRCRCSSAPWRSIPTMRRRMRWRRAGTACATARASRPTSSPISTRGRPAGPAWRSRSTASTRGRCRCAAMCAPCCSATTTMPSSCSTGRWPPTPARPIAWMRSSATFSYIGETREARRRADFGLRLSPYDANVFYSYSTVSLASYAAGDYDDAVLWARKSAALNPHFTANLRFLAASLAASGRIDEARQVAADLLRVHPQFNSRALRRGACLPGSRQAPAVRRPSRAGRPAGVAARRKATCLPLP